MRTASGLIVAESLSEAWLATLCQVSDASDRKQFQTVTRLTDPTTEDDRIRSAVDDLLEALDYQPVETVANTIFPYRLAQTASDVTELGQRYRDMYPKIRKIHPRNRRGTYFGRLVAYPTQDGPHDQLAELVRKLNQEIAGGAPKGARYEVPIAALVHLAGKDTSPMDFPCLSLCSFNLDHDALHLTAHYRSQHLVQRGYGNYPRSKSTAGVRRKAGRGQVRRVAHRRGPRDG